MFGGGFNQTPFNIPAGGSNIVEFAASLRGSSRVESEASVKASGSSAMYGSARIEAIYSRTITATPSEMHGSARVESRYMRYINGAAALHGAARLVSAPRKFRRGIITFTGSFPPGSEIVIDLKTLIVTQDRVNALRRITGDLRMLRLMPGRNVVRYTDNAGSRQIRIRVTHKDRFK